MQGERWRQVDKIFKDLIDQTPEQRASFLEQVCANDPSLKKEVEQLIEAYERSGSFLDSPAAAYGSLIGQSDQATFPAPSLVRQPSRTTGPELVIRCITRPDVGARRYHPGHAR